MSYNANIPQPNDFIDESQVDLLANFTVLDSNYVINHYTFSDQTPNKGKHRYVQMPRQNAVPPTASGDGNIFSFNALGLNNATKQSQLFFASDSTTNGWQLTRCIDSKATLFSENTNNYNAKGTQYTGGWTFLPGGMILQYGFITNPGTSGNIPFPVDFVNRCCTVLLTPRNDGPHSAFTYYLDGAPGLTNFSYRGSTSGSQVLYWQALGT